MFLKNAFLRPIFRDFFENSESFKKCESSKYDIEPNRGDDFSLRRVVSKIGGRKLSRQ